MFDEIAFSIRLGRLQARQRRVAADNDKKLRKLRQCKADAESIQAAEYDAWFDHRGFEGEIAEQQTRHLIRLAAKYLLTLPEVSDWIEAEGPYYCRHLKPDASARLRSAIRQEKRERWEAWNRWLPIITALAGLLGVVIGVIATLRR